MAPGPVDEKAARELLGHHYGRDVEAFEALRPGEWSSVFAFRRGTDELVVRFSQYRDDFEKDRFAGLHSTADLPVPEVLEIGDAFGGAYAVSRRARGEYLDGVDEPRMRALLPRIFAAFDAMRRIDLSSAAGYGLWRADLRGQSASWRETLLTFGKAMPPERSAGWREALAASPAASASFEEGLERMRQLVDACPEERHLLHSDLLNRNVLVEGDRLTAVLDWGSSIFGDFLWDVAWFTFWAPWYKAWSRIDFAAEAQRHYDAIGLRVPRLAERMRCYEIRIGLSGMSYQAWKGRWDDLAKTAKRTLEIARAT